MMARPSRSRMLVGLLALAGLAAGGCRHDDAAPEESAAVETTAERGPVRVTVRAEPASLAVGEKLRLQLEVVHENGVQVRMPVIADEWGPFAVRSASTPPDVPVADGRRWVHSWTLDTFKTGELELPGLEIAFTDERPSATGATGATSGPPVESTIATDPLTVEVRSVLAADEGEEDFHDIRASVDVPLAGAWWWWAAGAAVLLAAALVVIVVLRRRGPAAALAEPPPPPHVWALRMLDALAGEGLVAAGEIGPFYARLSGIVREYIERRFGIMAPERTTEEFLREARGSAALADDHKALLAGFLRAADMVKFARHRPSAAECESAFAAARGFVEQTAPTAPAAGDGREAAA